MVVRPSLFCLPATSVFRNMIYTESKLTNKQAFFFELHTAIDAVCDLTFELDN